MWIDIENLSKQQARKIEYILKDKIMSRIKIKLLNENCEPKRTHRWDAGWDLRAAEAVVIPAGETRKVHTGVIFEIPVRNCGIVLPRSSLGTKHRVTLANDVGVIDSEYRGEILVFLSNDSDKEYEVKVGDRFCQILIIPINSAELWVVDQLSITDRGDGGFGSTTEEELTKEEEELIPKTDMTDSAKKSAEYFDKQLLKDLLTEDNIDTKGKKDFDLKIPLKDLSPVDYIKLKTTGKLNNTYPENTGDIKVDLCL